MSVRWFLPRSAGEIGEQDLRIRRNVSESVRQICDRAVAERDLACFDAVRLAAAILDHRQSPGIFARYFETVYALGAGRADEAGRLLREMSEVVEREPRFEVRALCRADMGDEAARYARLLNAGEREAIFGISDPQGWDGFEANVQAALHLIEVADPALAAEIRGLIIQVVGAEPIRAEHSFGSVSSLTLWGAATLNLQSHRTALEVAEALVHEGAHLLLYALVMDQPLVLNDDAQRFASPLRLDARPMEGVFHATFVCARLHYFYGRLRERRPETLGVADLEAADGRVAGLAAQFADGAHVIAEEGQLSACGKSIFDATADYMKRAAV